MVKSMVLRELHTLEETTMDKVRFLMSDTGAQITEACREALEQKLSLIHISEPTRP